MHDKPFPLPERFGKRKFWRLREPDPRLFSVHRIACDYDPEAKAPQWNEFEHQIFPNDPQSIECLEEIIGYCMTADTSQQKAFIFKGKPRSGKGTIGRVLKAIVGMERFAGPTINQFGNNFGLQGLIGCAVAMIADARGQTRHDPHVFVERVLSITGEDQLSVPRKYQTDWNGAIPTRLIIASNTIPKLLDASGMIATRFIALAFDQSFLGREDPALIGRLLSELPGIVNGALVALSRLRERGRFIQPESGRKIIDEIDVQSNALKNFIEECCYVGPMLETPRSEILLTYNSWRMANGHKAISAEELGRQISGLNLKIEDARPRREGERVRIYRGVGLKRGPGGPGSTDL